MESSLPTRTMRVAVGAAIGSILACVAIASAFVIVAINPTPNGYITAAITGIGIAGVALAVAIVTVVLHRLRLPDNNDAWVYF